MQTWTDYEKQLAAKSHHVDQIPDLEDKNGNLSLPKLVAYLTNFQKDIGALTDRAERIDLLLVKIRSSESVCTQLTKDIETLRTTFNEHVKRLTDLQLAIQNLNEKHTTHVFSADQAMKSLSELTAAYNSAEQTHDNLGKDITRVENQIRDHIHSFDTLMASVTNLQHEVSELEIKVGENSTTLSRFTTTYKTIAWIVTGIFSIVGVIAGIMQAIPR